MAELKMNPATGLSKSEIPDLLRQEMVNGYALEKLKIIIITIDFITIQAV